MSTEERPRVCDECDGTGRYDIDTRPRQWQRCAQCDGWGYDRPSLVAWFVATLRAIVGAS